MKGNPKLIDHLNRALTNELTAINQYLLHGRLLQHWGIMGLGAHELREAEEERGHAHMLMERILFLDGVPNMQDINKIIPATSLMGVLQRDLDLEQKGIVDLREGLAHAESLGDYVTRDLFLRILRDEEEHVDFLETQQELAVQMGEQNYILFCSQLTSFPA